MERLREILQDRNLCWIHPNESIREAVRFMCQCKTGAMLVRDGDEAIGVFSERDLMHRVVNEGRDPETTLVKDVMSYNIVKIHINDGIEMAKALMCTNHVRHLMVVGEEDAVLGMVSIRDLMDHELTTASETIHALNDEYYERAYRPRWYVSSNRVIVERTCIHSKALYHPPS